MQTVELKRQQVKVYLILKLTPITVNSSKVKRGKMIQEILSNKRKEIAQSKQNKTLEKLRNEVDRTFNAQHTIRPLKKVIESKKFSIIAEIKRKSPSHGEINKNLNVTEVAKLYEKFNRISGISVLTDRIYFGGCLADLELTRSVTTKSVLRKEFILDEYQVYESKKAGADAVLLISTLLDKALLRNLVKITRRLGMEPLIECHKRSDIKKIPFDEVELVGINSRDLVGTLKTDLTVVKNILPLIPKDKIVIAESGVRTSSDLKWLHELGVNAVLIGAGILVNDNLSDSIKALFSQIPD